MVRAGLIFAAEAGSGDLAGLLVRLRVLSIVPATRPEDESSALALAAAIGRCAAAAFAGKPLLQRDVDTINSFAADEPPAAILRLDGRAERTAPDPVRAAFSAIARDAVETIAEHGRNVRPCAGGCGAFFVDDSRGRRRRWCSMTRCGNREKVKAFRTRVRES